jgi:flagellar hook-associated protein 3 FlgL
VVDVQKQLSDAETELTTGFLADPVESLGSQIGLDQSLQAQSAILSNFQTTNSIAQSTLTTTQNALTSISSDAQNFVNALLTAQSSGDIGTLQTQAQSYLTSLTSLLNTAVGGSYIFGGINNSVQPVTDDSQPAQAATNTAFQTAFGVSPSSSPANSITASAMQSFLTGAFASLFTGSNWSSNWSQASSTPMTALISPGQTVTASASANDSAFQQLVSAYVSVADLGIGNLNSSTQQAVLSNAQNLASSAMAGITNIQSTLGLSQSQITNVNGQMQTQASFIDNWVRQLQGVDAYQAATNLSNLTTQLETAYSLTDRISRLSLRQVGASSAEANLPRISCARISNLIVRLIRGKPCLRPRQMGQDFPRGVLVRRSWNDKDVSQLLQRSHRR